MENVIIAVETNMFRQLNMANCAAKQDFTILVYVKLSIEQAVSIMCGVRAIRVFEAVACTSRRACNIYCIRDCARTFRRQGYRATER